MNFPGMGSPIFTRAGSARLTLAVLGTEEVVPKEKGVIGSRFSADRCAKAKANTKNIGENFIVGKRRATSLAPSASAQLSWV
jgi:hypothetical protein